ncbi:hypothetical protein [Streptomyces daliensis]
MRGDGTTGRAAGAARAAGPLRLVALAAGTATAALLLAGCGIRATSVPVDAGAAPSRVGCVMPVDRADDDSADAAKGNPQVRIYLVCSSRVSHVERRVDLPDGTTDKDRLTAARTLLNELQAEPYPEEHAAGFETAVPRDLEAEAPSEGDPDATLRLSTAPDELPAFALAQIVCTYANTPAGDAEKSVTLGGPAKADEPPRRYECETALRTQPEAARTAGTRV